MFIDYLDRGFGLDPDATCMVRADGTVGLTHREFSALTHRVAVGLQSRDLGAGGKVAVFAPNGPLGYAAVLGVLRAGAGWVALNPRSEEDELTPAAGAARLRLPDLLGRLPRAGRDAARRGAGRSAAR